MHKTFTPLLLWTALLAAVVNAQEKPAGQATTGAYRFSGTTAEILGADAATAYAQVFPDDQTLSWELVVPERYDAADPPGILAYISPSNSGEIPRAWRGVTDTENLIWIAANDSGNRTAVARRMSYVLLGLGIVDRRYAIDRDRIYLAGFSGGAKVAGLVAVMYPKLFKGAIYIGGAELWDEEDAAFDVDTMRRNRYVFVAGSHDFNRRLARSVYTRYQEFGLEGLSFMLLGGRGHQLPNAPQFRNALRFLTGAPSPVVDEDQ